MIKRITVRIDEELENLITRIKGCKIMNLSALVREALKTYLKKLIDNSEENTPIEKGTNYEVRNN